MHKNTMTAFLNNLTQSGHTITEQEQAILIKEGRIRNYKKGEILFSEAEVTHHIAIVLKGVLASECIHQEESSISRFFYASDLCTNVESALQQQYGVDSVFAITSATVVMLPFQRFEKMYLRSEHFGFYLRQQLLTNTLTAKKIISIKSQASAKAKYEMLSDNFPWIVERVPQKYIASFLGFTPQGYNRFLQKQKKS